MASRKPRITNVSDDSPPPKQPREATNLQSLKKVVADFGAWKPAEEVLLSVRSVPTIFPQYDYTNRIGGHPLNRVVVVTGPSNHGKTVFTLGLLMSYLKRNHFAGLADAEQTTTFDWCKQLMREIAKDPRFLAIRPTSFEQMVASTREFANHLVDARAKGLIEPETGGLIV